MQSDRFVTDERHREREARRILDRVAQESEGGAAALLSSTTQRVRDHVAAADADPQDRIEVLGTRIGRSIGLLLTLAVIIALALYLANGG